jgi:hypothetical protein
VPRPQIGHPLPRARDGFSEAAKWDHWILAQHGHGGEWQSVFGAGMADAERLFAAIWLAIADAPVAGIRSRGEYGLVCGVDVVLTFNARTGPVRTSWHYANDDAAPRLVTAFPRP